MKYLADDGATFATEQACLEYERDLKRDQNLEAEAEHYLDLQQWPENEASAKRERSKALHWIKRWLQYDARQRPWRYEATADNPVAPVRPVEETDAA